MVIVLDQEAQCQSCIEGSTRTTSLQAGHLLCDKAEMKKCSS